MSAMRWPGRADARRMAALAADGGLFAHVVDSGPLADYPGQTQVIVTCPLCGSLHWYGEKSGARGLLGHRAAHCTSRRGDGMGTYWLVDLRDPLVQFDSDEIDAWLRSRRTSTDSTEGGVL